MMSSVRKRVSGAVFGAAIALCTPARAEVPEVRFARQFSMGYLQFNVIEHEKLIQKHAAALGIPGDTLQGVQDADVPWRHAIELVSRFSRDDVVLTLIKDGDHRLSRPEDIERLLNAVKEF